MSDDPISAVENLKPYHTVHIRSEGGPEFEITRLEGGYSVHREGDSNSNLAPRTGEFKFAKREEKKRDALCQLEDFQEGYGL